jgi:(R,R)-butanediol dehydrogenase/meso-butanediol dehydrogenase/diacetyl reductase
MKAAVLHEAGDVRIADIEPAPAPGPGDVRIRILRVGLCGSDVSEYDHGPVLTPLDHRHPVTGVHGPIVLGHEMLGQVEDVGAGVTSVRAGDRVVSGAGVWCGHCRWCRTGRTNLCAEYYTFGLNRNGGLTERVTLPARTLVRVPAGVADDNAVLAQPLAVCLHAVDRSGVRDGDVAVVIGAGAIGGFILAGLEIRRCAAVVAVDVDDQRLEAARALGATHVVNQRHRNTIDEVARLTDSAGADVVFEASGVPGMVRTAQSLARRGGKVQLVGLHPGDTSLDLLDLSVREVDISTSLAHVCPTDLPLAVDILTRRDLAALLVEAVLPLDQVATGALARLARREATGKFLVDPGIESSGGH